jgi:hypothetical protein
MKIAILGWGSLVWDPRGLPIKGDWEKSGPILPLEFSRVSKDARLTLVIDLDNGEHVASRYIESSRTKLNDAIADLRDREGTVWQHIGFVNLTDRTTSQKMCPKQADVFECILKWCKKSTYEAVIWTALQSQFQSETGKGFSVENAIEYLQGLPKTARDNALYYIERAPAEVTTPLRRRVKDIGLIK